MFNLQNLDIIELYEGKKKIFSNSLNTIQILFVFTSPNFESNDFY